MYIFWTFELNFVVDILAYFGFWTVLATFFQKLGIFCFNILVTLVGCRKVPTILGFSFARKGSLWYQGMIIKLLAIQRPVC
jgi:hypothetical protein